VMRLFSGKSCSSEEYMTKAHPYGRHFVKVTLKTKLKSQTILIEKTLNFVSIGNYLQASPISVQA
jgi:hypothetical protein